ncbi:MAG: hypothetical protein QM657_18310 [Lacrimispora sp.]|uniref:hypothetical protein n=1 Tax=Lacrimispora sp. TaxID=2719234 RepID=UPI0039E41B25
MPTKEEVSETKSPVSFPSSILEYAKSKSHEGCDFDAVFAMTSGYLNSQAETRPNLIYSVEEVKELINYLFDLHCK